MGLTRSEMHTIDGACRGHRRAGGGCSTHHSHSARLPVAPACSVSTLAHTRRCAALPPACHAGTWVCHRGVQCMSARTTFGRRSSRSWTTAPPWQQTCTFGMRKSGAHQGSATHATGRRQGRHLIGVLGRQGTAKAARHQLSVCVWAVFWCVSRVGGVFCSMQHPRVACLPACMHARVCHQAARG